MVDKIEQIGNGSLIQHGKLNDRIYLIKLNERDCPEILEYLRQLANAESYTKIFCKVPDWAVPHFFADGYLTEAIIPGFYQGKVGAFFLAKYLNSDRLLDLETSKLRELGNLLNGIHTQVVYEDKELSRVEKLGSDHVDQITELYKKVFLSYPFPIHNPDYILKTMVENIHYFGVRENGSLIAVASAEIDVKGKNAEMTDFATHPDFRGQKLGQHLLQRMEVAMKELDIKTLFTIARLQSLPMNKVFLKHRYLFGGTLFKNTNIAGSIESMNVYYKHI